MDAGVFVCCILRKEKIELEINPKKKTENRSLLEHEFLICVRSQHKDGFGKKE